LEIFAQFLGLRDDITSASCCIFANRLFVGTRGGVWGQRDDRFSRYQTAKKNGKLGEQTNLQGALALISNR